MFILHKTFVYQMNEKYIPHVGIVAAIHKMLR